MARDMRRREVIAGGGLVAASGILVACGSSNNGSSAGVSDAASSNDTPDETPNETTDDAQAAEEIAAEEDADALGDGLVAVADIPVEGGVVIADPPVVVVQPTVGEIKGFSAVCPHQGCLMASVEANEILCPCHGSLFSADDGSVLQGPANQGLPAVKVTVEGDTVILG